MNHQQTLIYRTQLTFTLLIAVSGCHLLHIPSYRADAPAGLFSGDCSPNGARPRHLPHKEGANLGVCPQAERPQADLGVCPQVDLKPVGGSYWPGGPVRAWWAEWRANKDLPKPAPYPRFHPLPTRPMFQPRPVASIDPWGSTSPAPTPYGQLPSPTPGDVPWRSPESSHSSSLSPVQPGYESVNAPAPALAPQLVPEPLPAEMPPRRLSQ